MGARRFEPRRELGRTGFVATRIGAGDFADASLPFNMLRCDVEARARRGDQPGRYGADYEDGFSEEVVGAALEGRREGVFVIDKIDHFDRWVDEQVRGSLARLRAPSRCFVFHGVERSQRGA